MDDSISRRRGELHESPFSEATESFKLRQHAVGQCERLAVHPLDFPVPDGRERLRRDRRGSAVAFPAGTRHPKSPPDQDGQAVTIQSEFNAKAQRGKAATKPSFFDDNLLMHLHQKVASLLASQIRGEGKKIFAAQDASRLSGHGGNLRLGPKRQKLLQKKTKQTKIGNFFLRSLGYLLFNSLPAEKRRGFSCRNQTPAKSFVISAGDDVKVGRVTSAVAWLWRDRPCAPPSDEKTARRGLTRPTNETQEPMNRLFSCLPGFLIPDKFKP